MNVRELLASVHDLPPHEAERLLMAAAGVDRAGLIRLTDVSPEAAEAFHSLVSRRRDHVPLQHLEGTVPFGPVELRVDGRALVPRPETEELWELVVGRVEAPSVIVDLCTGSGNLALALKHSFPQAHVVGTDVSPEALSLACENAKLTGLDVDWFEGDLFDALPERLLGRVDLLVSNPPYIAEAEFRGLPEVVRDHDPRLALIGGERGDEILGRIAAGAGEWLAPGGVVACEIGADQGDRVVEMFAEFEAVVIRDIGGRERFVAGRSPG